ncbi:MAG: SHOCT domain-containing protein [Microthrixaceae bacterium]
MMWWNGSWAWAWLVMVPMMVLMWALIALVVIPWARHASDSGRPVSPLERLDGRLATGDIDVDEYRIRRAELEHHA